MIFHSYVSLPEGILKQPGDYGRTVLEKDLSRVSAMENETTPPWSLLVCTYENLKLSCALLKHAKTG